MAQISQLNFAAMKQIKDVWFANECIYIQTTNGETFSQPLEVFPTLKEASDEQRNNFTIGKFLDDIRWECIDEDIHIDSFFRDINIDSNNEVADIFKRFPQLNVSEVAKQLGIHKSLLSQYIYGVKKPSPERLQLIKSTLRKVGQQLAAI